MERQHDGLPGDPGVHRGTRDPQLSQRRYRPVLHDTYEFASEAARAASGRGLSKQSFALRMRIVEVDAHALRDPRIWEVHPEDSFRELAGEPMPNTKKSWHGQMRRRTVLEKAGILLAADLPRRPQGAIWY